MKTTEDMVVHRCKDECSFGHQQHDTALDNDIPRWINNGLQELFTLHTHCIIPVRQWNSRVCITVGRRKFILKSSNGISSTYTYMYVVFTLNSQLNPNHLHHISHITHIYPLFSRRTPLNVSFCPTADHAVFDICKICRSVAVQDWTRGDPVYWVRSHYVDQVGLICLLAFFSVSNWPLQGCHMYSVQYW